MLSSVSRRQPGAKYIRIMSSKAEEKEPIAGRCCISLVMIGVLSEF